MIHFHQLGEQVNHKTKYLTEEQKKPFSPDITPEIIFYHFNIGKFNSSTPTYICGDYRNFHNFVHFRTTCINFHKIDYN